MKICRRLHAITSSMSKRPSACHISYVSVGAGRDEIIYR